MKDVNLNELTTSKLIELIAAVAFRIMGFSYVLKAFHGLVSGALAIYSLSQFQMIVSTHSPSENHSLLAMYASALEQFAIDVLIAIIFFRFTVPLARLASHGLSQALELKPQEQ
jgi:hypothetical protein